MSNLLTSRRHLSWWLNLARTRTPPGHSLRNLSMLDTTCEGNQAATGVEEIVVVVDEEVQDGVEDNPSALRVARPAMSNGIAAPTR